MSRSTVRPQRMAVKFFMIREAVNRYKYLKYIELIVVSPKGILQTPAVNLWGLSHPEQANNLKL